jgi:hypothetical protein
MHCKHVGGVPGDVGACIELRRGAKQSLLRFSCQGDAYGGVAVMPPARQNNTAAVEHSNSDSFRQEASTLAGDHFMGGNWASAGYQHVQPIWWLQLQTVGVSCRAGNWLQSR